VNVDRPDVLRQCSDLLAKVLPVLIGVTVLGRLEVVIRAETNANAVGANSLRALLDDLEG
jgi:hypothetical protein